MSFICQTGHVGPCGSRPVGACIAVSEGAGGTSLFIALETLLTVESRSAFIAGHMGSEGDGGQEYTYDAKILQKYYEDILSGNKNVDILFESRSAFIAGHMGSEGDGGQRVKPCLTEGHNRKENL